MTACNIISLENHRVSARPAASAEGESPLAAAIAAPDFGAAVPAEAEADARRASWHYPPAVPIVAWFPPGRTLAGAAALALEGLRLFAIAGTAAITVGSIFAVLVGAFAIVAGA